MKILLAWFVSAFCIVTPSISLANHHENKDIFSYRVRNLTQPELENIVNSFSNLTSAPGQIFSDALQASLYNAFDISVKTNLFICGVAGTFNKSYWKSNTCSITMEELVHREKYLRFPSMPGNKKTFIYNIILDIPSLIVNLKSFDKTKKEYK